MSGYAPLYDTMLSGTLYGRWPHTGIWACLLSRVSREGVIDETPASLAAAIGVSVDVLVGCINDFMEPDPDSRSSAQEGRRLTLIDPHRTWGWKVVNHGKYREKARKKNYDEARTESGIDAERKKVSRDVPRCPDVSRDVPLSSHTQNKIRDSAPQKANKSQKTGTRIPEDFSLTDERKAYGLKCGIDPERAFAKFTNHWRAKTGKDATKLDWDATWRTWCMNDQDWKKNGKSTTDAAGYRW